MTRVRRTGFAAMVFALAGGFGYTFLYPPLREILSGPIPGLLLTLLPAGIALAAGGWALWRIQEGEETAGRWMLFYLILLFLFGSGFALVRGNGSGAVVEVLAGMAGAGLFGAVWALLKGHRASMGCCFAVPALCAGGADAVGHGVWLLLGGLPGWILWGMVYAGGLGTGFALCVERMRSRPPRNILQEQMEEHARTEGGTGG